jgi:hypothetical protein
MNSYIETQNQKSYPIETNEEDSYIPLQVETLLSVK